MILQGASIVGALSILLPFTLSQTGHLRTEMLSFQILNVVGAAILTVVAIIEVQMGSFSWREPEHWSASWGSSGFFDPDLTNPELETRSGFR